MMESDNVKEELSRNLTFVAADSAIGNGPGGLDNLRPALLAKRGQAERAK
jgi:hypothetical protein